MIMIEAFIAARLDEDETIARAAVRHPTKYNRQTREFDQTGTDSGEWHTDSYVDPNDQCMIQGASMTIYDEGGHTAEQATHIARHDPARVLRQCAAIRAVVEFWQGISSASQQIEMEQHVLGPIAAIWSDHPDYQREWSA